MKTLNVPELQLLRKDIEAALASVAAKHNISLRTGKCKFSSANAEMKLEIAVLDQSGVAETKELAALKLAASMTGVSDEVLFKEFKSFSGTTYVLCGYCPRKPKYPFLAKSKDDGKIYGLTRPTVLVGLGFPVNSDKLAW
jgi:hypothetical protein